MTPQHHAGHFVSPSEQDRTAPVPAEEARRIQNKQGPARVLIVEDDFLIAMQTEVALTSAGFDVVGPATTAEEAVRELYQDFAIRCIFATAHDDAHTRGRAEPYAPLGWLPKPYTMASLVNVVAEAVALLKRP